MIAKFRIQSAPPDLLKKNGTIHWAKCAKFYGVSRAHTAKTWFRLGAPILDSEQMKVWLTNMRAERLRKIADKNRHYPDKEQEITRLYVVERMGLRAISRYFSGRPSTPVIRSMLIRFGVYRGPEVFEKQKLAVKSRRLAIVANEKEMRHRTAVCLWQLRKGLGVETTCKANGWNPKSIWNCIAKRDSYKRLVARRKPRWPDKRRYGANYSRKFPTESAFNRCIADLLTRASIEFVSECRVSNSRTRVDFKLSDRTFIECKVATNSGQTYEAIGQLVHYRKYATRVILCVPDDVAIRRDLFEIIAEFNVPVCTQATLPTELGGVATRFPENRLVTQRRISFRCKCCGSTEKRRHRSNSYCVECVPLIPLMRFDFHLNRWIPSP
jgi:hypothetical protein